MGNELSIVNENELSNEERNDLARQLDKTILLC